MSYAEYAPIGFDSSYSGNSFKPVEKGYSESKNEDDIYERFDAETITGVEDPPYNKVREVSAKEAENVDASVQKKLLLIRLVPLVVFSGTTFVLLSLFVLNFVGIQIIHPLSALMSAFLFGSMSVGFFRDTLKIGVSK